MVGTMIDPSNCPTPQLHGQGSPFRYCPNCTWSEADGAGPCDATILIGDDRYPIRARCEDYSGHAGSHHVTMDACKPVGRLVWDTP